MEHQSNQQPELSLPKCPDCGGGTVAPARSGMSFHDGKCTCCGNGFSIGALLAQEPFNSQTSV